MIGLTILLFGAFVLGIGAADYYGAKPDPYGFRRAFGIFALFSGVVIILSGTVAMLLHWGGR